MRIQPQALILLPETFSVCRLDVQSTVPEWAIAGEFFSVTRTAEELSIVCRQSYVPSDIQSESDWRCLKVAGPLDFSLTGVMASLTAPLAEAGISVFVISTFDTDYVMVKNSMLTEAIDVLRQVNHTIAE